MINLKTTRNESGFTIAEVGMNYQDIRQQQKAMLHYAGALIARAIDCLEERGELEFVTQVETVLSNYGELIRAIRAIEIAEQ